MNRDEDDSPASIMAPLLGPDALDEQPMLLLYRNERGDRGMLELETRARTTIGRDATCDLVFRDAHVSRRHATIDLIEGTHFLRDEGSSNGTYLNGLRLGSANAFALRARDVIEIGAARIHYVAAGDPRTPVTAPSSSSEGVTHDLADLVKDGDAVLSVEARADLGAELLRAFVGVAVAKGLERTLPLIAARLDVRHVAFFREDARHELRAVAALPRFESAGAVIPVALRAWRDQRGHIVRGLAAIDPNEAPETWVQAQTTSAAVPLLGGTRARGVLAVQRHGGPRLSRADLALLATIAARIAETMALKDTSDPGDTRT